jgi:hypothetical protein
MESGTATVPTFPGVLIPFQLSTATRKPALVSGTAESRWAGRTAAAATSTLTGLDAPNLCETRSCGLRENSWFGNPRNSAEQGK